MQNRNVWLVILLVLGMLLAACAPGPAAQDAMMEEKPAEPMIDKTNTPEMMEEEHPDEMKEDGMEKSATSEMMEEPSAEAMMEKTAIPMTGGEMPQEEMMAPAWFSTPLTDTATGETFKIEDFKGKVVLVETFAQWCSTCLRQQKEVGKLHEMMGMPADLVTVALDVDPNEDAIMLKAYLEKHGFDWRYAITPSETAREISDLYGVQFLNPPSAPMLIIDRQGEVHPLPFGVKTAADLQKALEPFIDGGM